MLIFYLYFVIIAIFININIETAIVLLGNFIESVNNPQRLLKFILAIEGPLSEIRKRRCGQGV